MDTCENFLDVFETFPDCDHYGIVESCLFAVIPASFEKPPFLLEMLPDIFETLPDTHEIFSNLLEALPYLFEKLPDMFEIVSSKFETLPLCSE
jgi:hypothetical protein